MSSHAFAPAFVGFLQRFRSIFAISIAVGPAAASAFGCAAAGE
jgi:hypothetical protein